MQEQKCHLKPIEVKQLVEFALRMKMKMKALELINDVPWQPVYDLTMDIFFEYLLL